MIKRYILIFVFLILFTFSSCSQFGSGSDGKLSQRELFAMDTYMTLKCYGDDREEALDEALEEIKRLDALLSTGIESSEVSILNTNGALSVSDDTFEIITKALEINDFTFGAYDITVYPLMKLWGFADSVFHLPSENEITEALSFVGSDKIDIDKENKEVRLKNGQGIDLGGIAKGYTSDRIISIFKKHSVGSAVISLGGNVHCMGEKTDGSLWRCGIKDPFSQSDDSYLGIISIKDKAVVSSGSYQRFFIDETTNKKYHHIIDPHTGYPSNSGLASATIVCSDGMTADALSTSCFIIGLEKSVDLWKNSSIDFDMILMTNDKTVYITEKIASAFKSDYNTEIIKAE